MYKNLTNEQKSIIFAIINQLNYSIMKGNILQGTARGRLGNVVARVVHGVQIYSNYQPNVSNPQSMAQTRQREMLSIATKKATVLNDLKVKGIEMYYSNQFGASRNIRNLIVSISTRAQRIADAGGQGVLKVPYVGTNSAIGNDFDLQINLGQVGLYEDLEGEKYAFGSDIPLDLNTKLGGFCTLSPEVSGVYGDCSNVNIFEADLVLTADTVDPNCLSLPKTYGLQVGSTANPPAVTGFQYVYTFPGSAWKAFIETMAGTGITDNGMKTAFSFLSWRDAKGNLIISKGSTKLSL